MADEPGEGPPGDVLSGSGGQAADSPGRRFRPWLWAVGGIAVASAVWAAVLSGGGATPPDLHGYRLGANPCDGSALSPLKSAVGARDFASSDATVSEGPALDGLSCVLDASAPAGDGWMTDYTVSVGVELHRRTDPRAEFENTDHARVSILPAARSGRVVLTTSGTGVTSAADVHPVTGVGDEARFLEPRPSDQTLEVLRGGAVLTLRVTAYNRWNGPGATPDSAGSPDEPDLSGLRTAMTLAMRHLMTSLAS